MLAEVDDVFSIDAIIAVQAEKYFGECGKSNVVYVSPVGSRETCDPKPTDTDDDRLVLVRDLQTFVGSLTQAGFTVGGSFICEQDFASLRRDKINIIATEKEEFYRRFMAATRVAKRFNFLKKADRITLFQAVLYGNFKQ